MRRTFSTKLLDQCLQRERIAGEQERELTLLPLLRTLPELAEIYGIREAYIFGSLAKPGRFRNDSDIDIAVWGLRKQLFFAFMAALRNTLAREVDVIELEQHPWREKILEDGIRWKKIN